jgi:hypothetical protein
VAGGGSAVIVASGGAKRRRRRQNREEKCSMVISGLYRATVSATALEDARRHASSPGMREKGLDGHGGAPAPIPAGAQPPLVMLL